MRKSMKLGAASTFAAVALVAGSASAASAFGEGGDYPVEPYICGNSSVGDGEGAVAQQTGYGPVAACQLGDHPIFVNNQNGDVEGGDTGALGVFENIEELLGAGDDVTDD